MDLNNSRTGLFLTSVVAIIAIVGLVLFVGSDAGEVVGTEEVIGEDGNVAGMAVFTKGRFGKINTKVYPNFDFEKPTIGGGSGDSEEGDDDGSSTGGSDETGGSGVPGQSGYDLEAMRADTFFVGTVYQLSGTQQIVGYDLEQYFVRQMRNNGPDTVTGAMTHDLGFSYGMGKWFGSYQFSEDNTFSLAASRSSMDQEPVKHVQPANDAWTPQEQDLADGIDTLRKTGALGLVYNLFVDSSMDVAEWNEMNNELSQEVQLDEAALRNVAFVDVACGEDAHCPSGLKCSSMYTCQ